MPIKLTAEDAAFLGRVAEMVKLGVTAEDIAAAEGMALGTFRYRVRNLGFVFSRPTILEARPQFGGKSFEQMKSDGEIVVAEGVPA